MNALQPLIYSTQRGTSDVLDHDYPPLLVINHVNGTRMMNQYLLSQKSCFPAEARDRCGLCFMDVADFLIIYRGFAMYYPIPWSIAVCLALIYEARHGNYVRR
jgi:hypothetical protein